MQLLNKTSNRYQPVCCIEQITYALHAKVRTTIRSSPKMYSNYLCIGVYLYNTAMVFSLELSASSS